MERLDIRTVCPRRPGQEGCDVSGPQFPCEHKKAVGNSRV